MLRRDGYLRVKETAALLGVCPNTVRAWGAAGRIAEYRNPVNKYRLYKQEDLVKLLEQLRQRVNGLTTEKRR